MEESLLDSKGKNLRVLYVSTHYGEAQGGGGIVAQGLSDALRKRGHIVTNVYLGQVSKLKCRLMPYLLFFRFACNASRHDIVFTHFHTFSHVLVVSYLAARLFGKSIIARIDDYFYTTRFRWFRILEMGLQNAVLKKCDRVFTVSEEYAKRIPIQGVGVIRNGVDLTVFSPHLRKTKGSVKRRSVIFLGVAYEHRAVDKLVKVAEELPNIDFLLVGESEFRNLPSNVKAFRVPHGGVPRILSESRVAINSLQTNVLNAGSSPTKVAEYIAFNLPIVSWKGSLDSAIPYFPVSNERELKETIDHLVEEDFKYDPQLVKQFDWNVIAEKVEVVMEELL